MFWLFSGTSPVGDLKMFLISQCFWLWDMTCWDSCCSDVCLLALSGACSRVSIISTPLVKVMLCGECEELKQGTGRETLWTTLCYHISWGC